MDLWKLILGGILLFIIIALPAFYFISGELRLDVLWKAGLPFLAMIVVVYFIYFRGK